MRRQQQPVGKLLCLTCFLLPAMTTRAISKWEKRPAENRSVMSYVPENRAGDELIIENKIISSLYKHFLLIREVQERSQPGENV